MSDEGYLEMTQSQYYALPQRIQDALRAYGREVVQGWGKPSRIYLPAYRLRELEVMMAEEGGKL